MEGDYWQTGFPLGIRSLSLRFALIEHQIFIYIFFKFDSIQNRGMLKFSLMIFCVLLTLGCQRAYETKFQREYVEKYEWVPEKGLEKRAYASVSMNWK